jgi:hypothetical protein
MDFIHQRVLKARAFFFCVFILLLAVFVHQAHAFPAPKFKEAVVFSWHTAGGSVKTLFISLISGPSPEDVASFTVTGPSGTFNLVPSRSYRQYGLQYVHEEDSVVTNGAYTFLITDTLGRTAAAVRNFIYNPSVPQVNSATMNPANGSYVGTTTPTLSFSPVPGNWYYQVIVLDYVGMAIWYLTEKTTATSFTVPPGLLQPDTPYIWMARVFDDDTDPQNVHLSDTLCFFTGTKDPPVLNDAYVAGWPYYGDKYRSVLVGKPLNIAPWDIGSLGALGPDSAVYVLDFPMQSFHSPTYYIDIVDRPFPQSIPDGPYTFTIQDKLGRLDSKTRYLVHTPLPAFSAGSFYPGENAYLDTNRPTFTWPRLEGDPGDGTYLYFIRINGYTASTSSGIIWYQSEPGVETSHTPPPELNLPQGSSYEWQYAAMGPGGDYNNWQFSVHHTFTINEPVSPAADIQANGSDGPVTAPNGTPVSVIVGLEPAEYAGFNADWWIAVHTPFAAPGDWYTYVHPTGWQGGIHRCVQTPLFQFSGFEVLNMALPVGGYTFYFAVDPPDGIPTAEVVDSVAVEVTP